MLTALFTGLGSIGQRHLRNLRRLKGDDVRILAYRTLRHDFILTDTMSVEADEGLERKYNIEVFNDLDRALAEKPTMVLVTNPARFHIATATRAAEAGCHLFIEKALSDSWDGVDHLVSLVKQRGLVGFVGFQMRFHPAMAKLSEWLAANRIGNLMAVHAQVGEYLPNFHPYEDYRTGCSAKGDLGGGVVVSQIHEYDYLIALFGAPDRIFAIGGHLSHLETDTEDVASVIMRCRRPDGMPLAIHLHQDYIQRPTRRECRIIGDRGSILWNIAGGSLTCFDATGDAVEQIDYRDYPRNRMFEGELAHFLECVESGGTPAVSIEEGARSLRVALAVKESMARGEAVAVNG